MDKLKVFTAFSGYDSQCMALERAGIDYELVGWSEIDRYAIQAHDAVFPQWAGRNYGDISKIDWNSVPDFDLFTYSSPCQDFSNAGRMAGGEEGSGTRSSLLWECKKAIWAKRPKYAVLENVKNLVSDKFYPLFRQWEQLLASIGYVNYWKVLNAKDYGVPQNRERVFLVSILDESQYFEFPAPTPCTTCMADILEPEVDERYYLSEKTIAMFEAWSDRQKANGNGFAFAPTYGGGQAKTITTKEGNRGCDNYLYGKDIKVAELRDSLPERDRTNDVQRGETRDAEDNGG